jgi:hypothetical protein
VTVPTHPPPRACPVCAHDLTIAAVACERCETQISGHFHRCQFCNLDDRQRELLLVFLQARGNTKELERHLGVSYPTARARLDELLAVLGVGAPNHKRTTSEVLHALARGDIDVADALREVD